MKQMSKRHDFQQQCQHSAALQPSWGLGFPEGIQLQDRSKWWFSYYRQTVGKDVLYPESSWGNKRFTRSLEGAGMQAEVTWNGRRQQQVAD